jgi:mannose-6-phosphate isomerase-like protein (cupin superfamily)
MKRFQPSFNQEWHLLAKTARSQAAIMVIEGGKSTGGPDNRHAASDQWMYVVEGEGAAVVNKRDVKLEPGTLLLIEAGESHQINNTGTGPLKTINFYAPPAY